MAIARSPAANITPISLRCFSRSNGATSGAPTPKWKLISNVASPSDTRTAHREHSRPHPRELAPRRASESATTQEYRRVHQQGEGREHGSHQDRGEAGL